MENALVFYKMSYPKKEAEKHLSSIFSGTSVKSRGFLWEALTFCGDSSGTDFLYQWR